MRLVRSGAPAEPGRVTSIQTGEGSLLNLRLAQEDAGGSIPPLRTCNQPSRMWAAEYRSKTQSEFHRVVPKSVHLVPKVNAVALPRDRPMSGGDVLHRIPFVVDEQPFACWDWQLNAKSNQFLRDLDSSYFAYIADTHMPNLEGDRAQYAAVAIRLAYSQALETLFALLGSLIHAPHCPLGWVLSYRSVDLYSLVEKVHTGRAVLTRLSEPPTWEFLAKVVHAQCDLSAEKLAWVQQGFALSWRRFAGEFLDKHFAAEYNALKHGFRSRLGGFSFAVGVERVPGHPAPAMQSLGGSPYGSSTFVKEDLGDKINFRPRNQARNWEMNNMAAGLYVLAMSINNIVSALRIIGGEAPLSCKFETPLESSAFDEPWRRSTGVTRSNLDSVLRTADIAPMSKKDIRDSYTNTKSQ